MCCPTGKYGEDAAGMREQELQPGPGVENAAKLQTHRGESGLVGIAADLRQEVPVHPVFGHYPKRVDE